MVAAPVNTALKAESTFHRSQAILLGASAGRFVLSLIITVLLARILSPADYGFFAFVSAVLVMGHDIADLGTGNVAAREVTRNPEREKSVLESLLGGRRVVSSIMAVTCLAVAFLHQDAQQRLVLCFVAIILWSMYLTALNPVFQVRQAHGRPVLLAVGAQFFLLLGCIILFLFKAAGIAYVFLTILRETAVIVGSKVLASRLLGFLPKPVSALKDAKHFFSQAAVFGLAALFYNLYFHNGTFFVWLLRPAQEAGAFSAAFRLIQPLASLLWVLMMPLIPVLTKIAARDRLLLGKQVPGLLYIAFGIGSISAVSGYLLGPSCIELLYGGKFSEGELAAANTFRWLSVAFGISCLNAVLVTVLLADGKEKQLLFLSALGFMLNVAANLLLLPLFGFLAVASVTALTELFVCMGGFLLIRKNHGSLGFTPSVVPFLLPMIALFCLFHILPSVPFVQISLGSIFGLVAVAYILYLPETRRCRNNLKTAED